MGATGVLRDHVIVVTGGTRGIGRGLVRVFAREGATIVVTGRRQDRVDDVAGELEAAGAPHVAAVCDAADRDATVALVDGAAARFGRVDGLVANAQTFRPVTPLDAVGADDFDLLLDTGPKATLWAMQAVVPHMRARGRGRIVTMGSAIGITGGPGYGPYAASKEAIRSLTRTAAREWGRDGITVNCVCAASVGHRLPPGDDPDRRAAFDAMYADHPIGRDGDPEADIAPAMLFLLSDASRYVTGQTLMVDGGGVMRA